MSLRKLKLQHIIAVSFALVTSYRYSRSLTDTFLTVFWTLVGDNTRFPYVNGVKASRAQIRLAQQLGGRVNYKVGKRYLDIAFPGEKLAVEYNGAKFHPDKQADMKRAREITKKGWRVLIIQVHTGFPDVRWVKQQITRLKGYKTRKVLYVEWNN